MSNYKLSDKVGPTKFVWVVLYSEKVLQYYYHIMKKLDIGKINP